MERRNILSPLQHFSHAEKGSLCGRLMRNFQASKARLSLTPPMSPLETNRALRALTFLRQMSIESRNLPPNHSMTAKSSTQDSAKHDIHASPFERITSIENEQEARVLELAERFEQEKREMEKSLINSEKTQEDMMRSKAIEELKEYSRTEPANILQSADKQTTEELASISKHAEKELPKALSSITSPLLDGSLFKAV